MNILVVEDDEVIREATLNQLAPMTGLGSEYRLEALMLKEKPIVEQAAVTIARKWPFHPSFCTLVLDIGLGLRPWGGLEIMRYLKHSFDGTVIIHSSQHHDKKVQDEARRLGIRFGVDKNADNLPEMIRVVSKVAFLRSATLGQALHYERNPLPDYVTPEGTADLDEMFLRLKRLGRAFDGTSESVDWEKLAETQELIKTHVKAAREQGYARFYKETPHEERDGPFYDFFEDFVINSIPVLLVLEKSFKRKVVEIEPFVTF